jgi:putative ABC transport system substrate-binding protein
MNRRRFLVTSLAGALAAPTAPEVIRQSKRIAELALRTRLPTAFARRENVAAGGLVSYGVNLADQFRRTAAYVVRIFKGASPGDLPVEQPSKLELVINLKTAKTLGLTIPESLLLRANVVIE